MTGDRAKPDLREQVGVAVNSTSLVLRARGEGDLDRVAALGAATLTVQLGVELRSGLTTTVVAEPFAAASITRNRVAAELGALLWHVRYGGQHGHLLCRGESSPGAIALFVGWMMERPQFAAIEPELARKLLLQQFAPLAIHEWLSDRCIACGGSGKLERTRGGALIRPRGAMQRNARFATCRGCGGNGRARPNHKMRARAMGVPLDWYFDQHWPARFILAFKWLTYLAGRLSRPLRAQLERGSERTRLR